MCDTAQVTISRRRFVALSATCTVAACSSDGTVPTPPDDEGSPPSEPTGTTPDTTVSCPFEFHALRSEQLGVGPFGDSYFDVTVRDGEVIRARTHLDYEEFSPQVWEPFADWVSATYPEDAALMYDESLNGVRLSARSNRLWEEHSTEFAQR